MQFNIRNGTVKIKWEEISLWLHCRFRTVVAKATDRNLNLF